MVGHEILSIERYGLRCRCIDNAEAWTDERLVDLLEGVVETHNFLHSDQDSTHAEEVSVPLLAVVEQT
ncbi:MAG: hypothetical protein AAFS10_01755 [Myxococcota bacterium]